MNRVLAWQLATVRSIRQETPRVKTFTLSLPHWQGHKPGQHVDVRLTAPDGYQAQRSYSIASEPERPGEIDLTVERIDDGEVSTYLHDVVIPGDQIELRGPVGGYFVWETGQDAPLLLVAGGSGVVPLMAMLRHRRAAGAANPSRRLAGARLLYSTRTAGDLIYAEELNLLQECEPGVEIICTFTRQAPPGWSGYARRIDAQMLGEVAAPLGAGVLAYVCGPTPMVEAAASGLVQAGLSPGQIRTERFGPTGA